MSLLKRKMLQYSFTFAAIMIFPYAEERNFPAPDHCFAHFKIEPHEKRWGSAHSLPWATVSASSVWRYELLVDASPSLHHEKNERVIRKVCAKTMQIRCSLWHPNKPAASFVYIIKNDDASKVIAIFEKAGKIILIYCGLNWMHWLCY